MTIIGPGFPAPPNGNLVPRICAAGTHRFEKRGVCRTCWRTVSELARLGLARPMPCRYSGIHALVGKVCIECKEVVIAPG